MNVSILICSHGDEKWQRLAGSRAAPSARGQCAGEVLEMYDRQATLAEIRNLAGDVAENDWLCFLDADDELAPGFLAAATAPLLDPATWDGVPAGERPRLLLAPAIEYVHAGVRRGRPAIPNKGRWPDLNECVIGTLVSRDLFLEVGGFRDLPSLEDYDLWLRCVRAGARIVHVPDAIYLVHVSPRSRNSDQSVYDELRLEHAEVWA